MLKLLEMTKEPEKQTPNADQDPCMSLGSCDRDSTLTPVSFVFLLGNK